MVDRKFELRHSPNFAEQQTNATFIRPPHGMHNEDTNGEPQDLCSRTLVERAILVSQETGVLGLHLEVGDAKGLSIEPALSRTEELLTDLIELVSNVLRLRSMPLPAGAFGGSALTGHENESRADVTEGDDGEITRSLGKEEPFGLLVNGGTKAGANCTKLLGRGLLGLVGLLRLLGLLGLLGLARLLELLDAPGRGLGSWSREEP